MFLKIVVDNDNAITKCYSQTHNFYNESLTTKSLCMSAEEVSKFGQYIFFVI